METQTLLFEGQAAVLQQLANLLLGSCDEIFVRDAMNAAGLHRIEMRHQLDIISIIPPDAREVEGKGIRIEEIVFEDGKSAAERVTPGIDDLCLRQRCQDHA